MKKLFLAISLLPFLCNLSQAEVYRCIDRDGNEVYNSEGGPNCTLLYADREDATPAPEKANVPSGSPREQGTEESEGGSLTFVETTSDVREDQVVARGSVKNDGVHLLRSVRIVVECFDAEDAPVATESSYAAPQDIPPGGTAEYEVMLDHDPRMKTIKTSAHWTAEERKPTP